MTLELSTVCHCQVDSRSADATIKRQIESYSAVQDSFRWDKQFDARAGVVLSGSRIPKFLSYPLEALLF